MGAVRHTPRTRAKLIKEFSRCGRIDLACERAGCSRDMHYEWLGKYPEYKQAFEQARDKMNDVLEGEAHRRAYEGTTKPVYQGGVQVGQIQEYSDTLLMFLLKCRRPAVFGDKTALAMSGPSGEPLNIKVEFVDAKKEPEAE